jgi:hypothetical protein
MKVDTSPGIDGLTVPFLKFAFDPSAEVEAPQVYPPNLLVPWLSRWFHALIQAGKIPAVWKQARITPIFKDGDPTDPGRYRMIAVNCVLYRLFANVLRHLVTEWCKVTKAVPDTQFGFFPGRSTFHPCLILHHAVHARWQSHRGEAKRLYTAFIDFSQAYDHVRRSALWQHLHNKLKMPSWMLSSIKGLYDQDMYVLVDGTTQSPPIYPNKGVKQGCPLSPLLFSLYCSDIHECWPHDTSHGVRLDNTSLTHLMFADDLALTSDTSGGVQCMLDRLHGYATRKHLYVNVSKSKVMVFRPARARATQPHIFYAGQRLPVVDSFRYLGLHFDSQASLSHMAEQLRGGMYGAVRDVHKLASEHGIDAYPEAMLHLYRAFVMPHAMFGCQVWGTEYLLENDCLSNPLQITLNSFYRSLLGLRKSVAGSIVLHELAQPPLQYYWLRAICRCYNTMPLTGSDVMMQALRADASLAQRDPKCWSSKLNRALQSVLDQSDISLQADHTVLDNQQIFPAWRDRWQGRWLQHTSDPRSPDARMRETLTYAAWFKQGEGMQWKDLPVYLSGTGHDGWRCIAHFRLGNHGLRVETGRWTRIPYEQRVCNRCQEAGIEHAQIDDAHHFLFDCVLTRSLREAHQFHDLFQSCSGDIIAFLADTRANSFINACMIKLAAAAVLAQQGPAAQVGAGG